MICVDDLGTNLVLLMIGTGTQAGDPKEASAIATTFFPPEYDHSNRPKLFVGSVKTVIGHTEGCA